MADLQHTNRFLGSLGVFGCLFVSGACVVGCSSKGPLAHSTQPRSPYAQYQTLRDGEVPLHKDTALGETHPNLRGRLLRENSY